MIERDMMVKPSDLQTEVRIHRNENKEQWYGI